LPPILDLRASLEELRETASAGSGHHLLCRRRRRPGKEKKARVGESGVGEAAVVWEHVEERREKGTNSPRMHTRRGRTAKCRSGCSYYWTSYSHISFFILRLQIHMQLLLEMV
jgi:hypothetical protein